MNMLIIGNGFDLAHGRPTTYVDFLKFLDYILLAKDFSADRTQLLALLNKEFECRSVTEYILSSFDTKWVTESGYIRNSTDTIQELYNCLDKNVWYEYFQLIHRENEIHGKNWIDFESEIRQIIEFLDREIEDIYDELSPELTSLQSVPIKVACFCKKLDFSEYNQINHKSNSYKNTYYDLIEKNLSRFTKTCPMPRNIFG